MNKARARVLVVAVAVALVAGACATMGRTTVDGSAPTTTRLTGKFVWHDLLTDDVELATRFYSELLGWEFERGSRLGRPYYLARLDGAYVGGVVPLKPREPRRRVSQWVGYVSVPSVEQAARKAEAAGGSVARGPLNVGDVGRAALVRDPAGAPFGLATAAAGDPADESDPATGRFFWMEYLARDVPAALDFYRDVVGYRVDAAAGASGYFLLETDRDRAGLYANPVTDAPPVWLPYIRVEDPAALAVRVAELGGRVLLDPASGARDGSFAIVADPSGAVFALQRYPM